MRGSGLRGGCSILTTAPKVDARSGLYGASVLHILTTAPEVDARIWAMGWVFYTDLSSGGGCEDLGYGVGVLY